MKTHHDDTKPATIRVRIPVAVNAKGKWCAGGYGPDPVYDDDNPAYVFDAMPEETGGAEHVVWVEADVPLPASKTVEGEVGKPTPT